MSQAESMLSRTVLGRYRIVRQLAHGGMGAVYLGRTEGAEGFARPVVIKRVLPTLMGDQEVAQMFVREARILSNLHHPNIVTVLDFGQDADGAYVMVLDYVHGYPFGHWQRYVRRRRGLLPAEYAIYVVLRVLDALHYAHTFKRADGTPLQIIHRDVSPSNILLDLQGQVKLLDFGIARVSGDDTEFKTERPKLKGKLPYLALEMFKGSEPSVQSDLYSCGVVLYEALTGINPFAAPETAQIYYKILHETPQSIHAVRDDAPEAADEVIMRALAKEPSERFASAQEMSQALRELRTDAEEDVAARMTEQLRVDFTGDMPRVMRLEPLERREQAWRKPEQEEDVVAQMTVDDDEEGGTDEIALGGADGLTLRASVEPGLLDAARGTQNTLRAGDPAAGRRRGLALAAAGVALLGAGMAAFVALEGSGEAREAEPPPAMSAADLPAVAPQPATDAPAGAGSAAEAGHGAEAEAGGGAGAEAGGRAGAGTGAEAGGGAQAEAAPPKPAPPNPRRLTRIFGRRSGHVESCFTRHAKELAGRPKLSIRFVVKPNGRVKSADIMPPAIASTALGGCLSRVAKATYFGPQQREVAFRIPITARRVE